jgi:adenosylmethionine-8-amino-7-oxononanoate aminotransferase
MANPLACAVALASLGQLADGDWSASVARIEDGLEHGLGPARDLPGVADVRVLGAIGVVQMRDEVDLAASSAAAIEAGVWLRPFRDLIYTMPPYVISDEDLVRVTVAVLDAARAASPA